MEKSFKEIYATLTEDQKFAIDILIKGKNVFLTGEAGTGKSYVINAYTKYCEENDISIAKCAPTGIAAVNIEGSTLHHQFGLDLTPMTRIPYTYEDFLDNVDVVLIDEISMCRIDIFEFVMMQIMLANKNPKRLQEQKLIQIVLVGDFFQLPPVITEKDRLILEQYFNGSIGKGFAFQSNSWREFGFRMINLTTIVRQSDKQFCENLSKARHGDYSCVRYIEEHSSSESISIKESVCLTGKNSTALSINQKALELIEGEEYKSTIILTGEIDKNDYPCDDEFIYKKNCRVMSLINEPSGLYFNGFIGTIVAVAKDGITVKFDDGVIAKIEKHTFECYRYEESKIESKNQIKGLESEIADIRVNLLTEQDINKIHHMKETISALQIQIDKIKRSNKLNKVVIGTATQFPLKLAYAITIHKSQGQTFEKINIIPEIFDDGQFYVAVSRGKSINNIHFVGSINPNKIKSNKEVEEFYADPDNYSFFNKKYLEIKMLKEQYTELVGKILNDPKCYKAALEAVNKVQQNNSRADKILALKMKMHR